MDSPSKRDQYLQEQSARFGDALRTLTLIRVMSPGVWNGRLALLLIGDKAAYGVAAPTDPSIFGIPLPAKTPPVVPEPFILARETITFEVARTKTWWGRLWAPRDVVDVYGPEGSSPWAFQLFGSAKTFVSEWNALWTKGA